MSSQDPSPPTTTPSPTLNVLCFGDSLTAGYTSTNEYFPYARYLKHHLESYNASKSSISSSISSSSNSGSNSGSGGGSDSIVAVKCNDAEGDDTRICDTFKLQPAIAIAGSQRSVRVDKIGVSGWTTLEMVLGMDDYENIDCFGQISHGLGYQLRNKGPYNFAFILAGTNDIGEGLSTAKMAANIESLIECCLSKSDSIKVGVILVPPCGAEKNNKRIADDRAALNSYIRSLPIAHKKEADRDDIVFVVDCLKELPNDGSDEALWDWDTLHLSSCGSEVLGKVVFESMLKYL